MDIRRKLVKKFGVAAITLNSKNNIILWNCMNDFQPGHRSLWHYSIPLVKKVKKYFIINAGNYFNSRSILRYKMPNNTIIRNSGIILENYNDLTVFLNERMEKLIEGAKNKVPKKIHSVA